MPPKKTNNPRASRSNEQQQQQRRVESPGPVKKHARMSTGGKAPKKPLMTKGARMERAAAAAMRPAAQQKKKSRHGKIQKSRTYKIYIYKVLKSVYPELGISSRAMDVMNNFCQDMFMRIAKESGHLCQISKKPTLSARAIQSAVKLVLSEGDVCAHALNEGAKALSNMQAATKG